jgi:hypothetical protein
MPEGFIPALMRSMTNRPGEDVFAGATYVASGEFRDVAARAANY